MRLRLDPLSQEAKKKELPRWFQPLQASLAGTENRDDESDWIKLGIKLGLGAVGQIRKTTLSPFSAPSAALTISLSSAANKSTGKEQLPFQSAAPRRCRKTNTPKCRPVPCSQQERVDQRDCEQVSPGELGRQAQECTFWLAPNRNILVKRRWLTGTCLGPDGGENASNRIVKTRQGR